jgi:hypothetical protein
VSAISARMRPFQLILALSLAGCAAGGTPPMSEQAGSPLDQPAKSGATAASGATNPSPTSSRSPSETSCRDPLDRALPLPVGARCRIDIATDDDMPVRVSYTIPRPGWSAWFGAYKDVEDGDDDQYVSVLIEDLVFVTINACPQQPADPPVGAGDLAAALSRLPPFEVSSPPMEVTAYGYSGMHVQIKDPDQMDIDGFGRATIGCQQSSLMNWILLGRYNSRSWAMSHPGDSADFWILDVEGTGVVIAALATANASKDLRAEQQAILDSIVIEP